MTNLLEQLQKEVASVAEQLYATSFDAASIKIDKTPPDFDGEFTVVVFTFVKASRKSPEATANELGAALMAGFSLIKSFNVVKGFLNISFTDDCWLQILSEIHSAENFGQLPSTGKQVVVEYCGPNTNKPLHLGHIRNILLGYSTANILSAAGHSVHKVNILNDRGIAICKSMVAYKRNGNGSTPASIGMKGDHFVGKYYVEYSKIIEAEISALMNDTDISKDAAEKQAPIYLEAQEMLLKWEAGDSEVMALWNMMNSWVYSGFDITYKLIGIDFEKEYKESEFYLNGKKMVLEGLNSGAFFKKEDGSVWVDLTSDGLDQKVLLRADGTSVYITQDMGVAEERYRDFTFDESIYVVANEQDYHFKVLKLVLQKLGRKYADGIHHMSYGMVDLPEGKMKSREGTVVDADDLIEGMVSEAMDFLASSEKNAELNETEKQALAHDIGMSALKYFILKVDPKKRILFNPKESIDLHGNTGPFIQYAYARIRSILRKIDEVKVNIQVSIGTGLMPAEKELIIILSQYPGIVKLAAETYSPAEIGNYLYLLAKKFNSFYADHSILKAESEEKMHLRAVIALHVSLVIKHGLDLLGIHSPEKM
ncbi:MAG TPA: arginine--tRNA ligase [Chitinophagales bacterium]|nr:arginine--tRNA ligase [Chitinophagales bacterium]